MKGIFGIIDATNGLGKTTQLDCLRKYFNFSPNKYPVYSADLCPNTGPQINNFLRDPAYRQANPLTSLQEQKLFADNRHEYEETLIQRLNFGENIISESYKDGGVVWGMVNGSESDRLELERYNKGLIDPDFRILLDGEPFTEAFEKGHKNETNEKAVLARAMYRSWYEEHGLPIVNANQDIQKVTADLVEIISQYLPRKI